MKRRRSRAIKLGDVSIGGDHPVSVQSMTTTHTEDVAATVAQIAELTEAGCEIIRVAVPTEVSARAIGDIKPQVSIPLVADIHFDMNLAIESLKHGADGIRINPGNMKDLSRLDELIGLAEDADAVIRIGVSSGSVRPRKGLSASSGAEGPGLAELMVEKTLEYVRLYEKRHFHELKLSLKASDVPTTMAAYREISRRTSYPLHLGVTAAGPYEESVVKSAIGIGGLLAEGIGDTIRVSMTGPPAPEVKVAFAILSALGLRGRRGPEIVSCPTCGRCEIDLPAIVEEVKRRLPTGSAPVQIAVMGCVVNGPGEAAEADLGIAGGKGFGYLFVRGRKLRKVPAEQLVDELMAELDKLNENQP